MSSDFHAEAGRLGEIVQRLAGRLGCDGSEFVGACFQLAAMRSVGLGTVTVCGDYFAAGHVIRVPFGMIGWHVLASPAFTAPGSFVFRVRVEGSATPGLGPWGTVESRRRRSRGVGDRAKLNWDGRYVRQRT